MYDAPQPTHKPAENSTISPKESIHQRRRVDRAIFVGIQDHDFKSTVLRILLILFRETRLRDRDAAPLKQKDFSDDDGVIDEAEASKAIRYLLGLANKKKTKVPSTSKGPVIERIRDAFSFKLPVTTWCVPFRAGEGRRKLQLEFRFQMERIAQQLALNLSEVSDGLAAEFLAGEGLGSNPSQAGPNPTQVGSNPSRQVGSNPSPLGSNPTHPAALYNVSTRVRSILRHTSDAQSGDSNRILQIALDYIGVDGPAARRKEENNPIFLVISQLPDWPNPIEDCVTECKTSTTPTLKTRAKRLMDALKAKLGPEKWFELFPNSKASFYR
jgi:hypothetical protein